MEKTPSKQITTFTYLCPVRNDPAWAGYNFLVVNQTTFIAS